MTPQSLLATLGIGIVALVADAYIAYQAARRSSESDLRSKDRLIAELQESLRLKIEAGVQLDQHCKAVSLKRDELQLEVDELKQTVNEYIGEADANGTEKSQMVTELADAEHRLTVLQGANAEGAKRLETLASQLRDERDARKADEEISRATIATLRSELEKQTEHSTALGKQIQAGKAAEPKPSRARAKRA